MSEAVLAPRPKRVPLKGLSAATFQHPFDRQAAIVSVIFEDVATGTRF